MSLIVKKTKISPDTSVPIEAICLPDREARIAELAYLKRKAEALSQVTNLKTGWQLKVSFCCK